MGRLVIAIVFSVVAAAGFAVGVSGASSRCVRITTTIVRTVTATLPAVTVTTTAPGTTVTTTVPTTVTVTTGPATTTTGSATTTTTTPPATLGTSLPARMPESSGLTTLYVATNGADSNPGSILLPVQSIGRALDLATSGTIVYIRGGNYGWQLTTHHSYSPANPVTIQSYLGERAVFVGNSDHGTNAVTLDDLTGLRIQNVTFAAPQNTTGLKFTNPSHVEINNVLFRDTDSGCNDQGVSVPSGSVPACGWGIGLSAIGQPLSGWTNQLATDFQVWNSTFTNNGAHSHGQGGASNHGHAMLLCAAGVSGGPDDGCNGFVVANNLVFDSPTGNAIRLGDAAHNGFVVNNTVDNTDTRAIQGPLCTDYSGAGITLWGDYSWPNRNILVANNLITNNCANAVIATGFTGGGDVIRNNLGFHNDYACDWPPDCTTEYNCTWGTSTICTVGANLPGADPLYVNRAGAWGDQAKDFHLQAGSPALGVSDPAFTPPYDKDGLPRPAAPALGSYG